MRRLPGRGRPFFLFFLLLNLVPDLAVKSAGE